MNRKKFSSNTKKIALSAVLTALSVIFLMLGAVIEVLDLTTAAFASFTVVLAVIEIGGYYPFFIYASTSALSLILIPNKLPVLVFACFFGIYPLIKAYLERFHYIVAWSVKISTFNIMLAGSIFISKFILSIQNPMFSFEILIFALANIAFLLYDIAMTQLITFYLIKIRKVLGLKNYFE